MAVINCDNWCLVRLGACESMLLADPERELNSRINKAMRWLFDGGHRRFRIIRRPRTGDDIKVAVLGFMF